MSTVVLFCILVFGVLLIMFAVVLSSATWDALGTDVAKAGVQIAAITFVGAVVTVALKYLEDRRRLNERRLQVLHEILDAYNRVKAVRRNLRSLGVVEPKESLNAEQAHGLRQQMAILNDAQLSLEATQRELKETGLFTNQPAMWLELRKAEHYLGQCVYGPWERAGGNVWEGATPTQVGTIKLQDFAGYKRDGYTDFIDNVSDPLDELTKLIHKELFGASSTPEQQDPRLPCEDVNQADGIADHR